MAVRPNSMILAFKVFNFFQFFFLYTNCPLSVVSHGSMLRLCLTLQILNKMFSRYLCQKRSYRETEITENNFFFFLDKCDNHATSHLSWCYAFTDCPQVALTSQCRMHYRTSVNHASIIMGKKENLHYCWKLIYCSFKVI